MEVKLVCCCFVKISMRMQVVFAGSALLHVAVTVFRKEWYASHIFHKYIHNSFPDPWYKQYFRYAYIEILFHG